MTDDEIKINFLLSKVTGEELELLAKGEVIHFIQSARPRLNLGLREMLRLAEVLKPIAAELAR